ncbi:MAG: peptidase M23 family protein [Candidatus Gottesmanbacteria bacterium GW2011_GWA2_43_14]|uniref:Peptidase M23 family protein n=1 Tax=Candidatus Gottesmanbacteria bacterium GW2011_GWA2_43_14 TaxID=1618443 RepID=A0A0G1DJC6_9BACT|nr:MAG: peptidase M23 family protein [Candidatus Gottesmanbacteria bacterium GW2011_GWA2_43_14]
MHIPEKIGELADIAGTFRQDVADWLNFLYKYTRKRLLVAFSHFEDIKDSLVDVLLVKRGRYSKHFLNISFLFLIAGAIIGGPVIAEYYPTVAPDDAQLEESSQDILSTYQQGDLTTTTVVSDKPRFEIIDYEVNTGDTLGSIAEKFGISVDTIKWANSLKTEKLISGQSLRIPPVTGIVHKVAAGDNIYSLAKKYKTDAQKIVNFPVNDFADLDTFALSVGQTLFVPDGVKPEAAPIYRSAPVPQFIAGSGGKFMWPTQGSITQYPVSYHMAVDIANRAAPPIAAGDGGTVAFAGCLRYGYGCHIIINHADGYQTLYAHLSSLGVSPGQAVGRGQVIGKMGSTGRSSGTHLHFEVRRNGTILNPLSFL